MTNNIAFSKCNCNRSRRIRAVMLALASSTVIAAANPAMALDATDFFKALQNEAEKNGNTMTFESLEFNRGRWCAGRRHKHFQH